MEAADSHAHRPIPLFSELKASPMGLGGGEDNPSCHPRQLSRHAPVFTGRLTPEICKLQKFQMNKSPSLRLSRNPGGQHERQI
jgi:hypothetical protein